MLSYDLNKYVSSDCNLPFFMFVGDEKYLEVRQKIYEYDFQIIRVSSFCKKDDKLPDIDLFFDTLSDLCFSSKKRNIGVIGLGEYLSLCGRNKALSVLMKLKDINLFHKKVILILRGTRNLVSYLRKDQRFDYRRFYILGKTECSLKFVFTSYQDNKVINGFKELLIALEDGLCGITFVNTKIRFRESMFTIRILDTPYEWIIENCPSFNIPSSCGEHRFWCALQKDMQECDYSFDKVLFKHGIRNDLNLGSISKVLGYEYGNWLFFLALKSENDSLGNEYLECVLKETNNFYKFKENLLNKIVEINPKSENYQKLFRERKSILKFFTGSDIANFVINNRKNVEDSVFRLTDSTIAEKEELIRWTSKNGLIKLIDEVYPFLSWYMKPYRFDCGDLSDLFTNYFQKYKEQKLANRIDPDFLELVDLYARRRVYNRLPSRNEVMDDYDTESSYLYWLDAMGVEYLSFVSKLASKKGLSISVRIVRSDLPTITSVNKDFFDLWKGTKKETNKELDEIKHKNTSPYNFEKENLPIHLAKELDIISSVVEKAAMELELRHCKKFIIVSDHGASRLAVLRKKEEKYHTDTKGEHSGRCCKMFKPYELPFAAEENGYLILADYGRFKGSRAANVEVHGGASLEEAVVPIIELSLKNKEIQAQIVNNEVYVDYKTCAEIELFFKTPVKSVMVVLNGNTYQAKVVDDNHYVIKFADVRKVGEYTADVYVDNIPVNSVQFYTKSRVSNINDAFDELF